MCISPITIPNPYWKGCRHTINVHIPPWIDTDISKLKIPCGVCPECIAVKQMYEVQRVQMESLKNHMFFSTMTYSNSMLPTLLTSTGYEIPFADIRDFQLCVKRIYNDNAFNYPFRWYCVSELGSKKGRPHFHCLWLIERKYLKDYNACISQERLMFDVLLRYWSRNYGSKRVPDYKPLCEYHTGFRDGKIIRNFDLHYVNPSLSDGGASDVAFYVLKYMLKPSNREIRLQQALRLNLPDDEYESIWSTVRSKHVKSLGFGVNGVVTRSRHIEPDLDIIKYLRSCVEKTPRDAYYPWYFNPDTGLHFPLSRYYRSFDSIFNYQDALDFYYYASEDFPDFDSGKDANRIIDSFLKTSEIADMHSYDDLFTNF